MATAVGLVRAGVPPTEIVCLDRAHFPRAKPCGGGLTGHALSGLAALGLALRVRSAPCRSGLLSYGRRRHSVALERAVHVVRREELDADLVEQARTLGLRVIEGEAVAAFDATMPQGVCVTTSAGRTVEARALVGADGAGSIVRRALLADEPRPRRPIRLCRLEIADPGLPAGRMVYDFSPMAAGMRGYAWAFPVPGGRLNVGAMHVPAAVFDGRGRDRAGTLEAWLGPALARFGIELPGPARGWPVWPYDGDAAIGRGPVLLVGDAAGVDALTGEGIAVALEQGAIAASVIAESLRRGGRVELGGYGRAVRRAPVGRELALDDVLARLLYGAPDPLPWLSLVMEDERMQALYAARVCGARVLADAKRELLGVLARHAFLGSARTRRLAAAAP